MKDPNGSKQVLLWINTLLTAACTLLAGGAGFIGTQLWIKIDRLNDSEIRYEEKVKNIEDAITNLNKKQDSISREHHAIFLRLDRIEKLPRP